MMKRTQAAQQLRRAIQLLTSDFSETQVLEVAAVFDPWRENKAYTAGEYVVCGENRVGDPQIYKVIQAHTSQSDWRPDETASLYAPLGLADNGYPLWSQPAGAYDAYEAGDIVSFNQVLYRSLVDGNVYSPEEYPAGWEIYE